MEIIFYSAKRYDHEYFNLLNRKYQHKLRYVEDRLTPKTVDLYAVITLAKVKINPFPLFPKFFMAS